MYQLSFFLRCRLLCQFQLFLSCREFAILQFGCFVQIVVSLGNLNIILDLLDLLFQVTDLLNACLFILPFGFQIICFIL